jgi:hypothetical protein
MADSSRATIGRTFLSILAGVIVSLMLVMLGDGVSATVAPLPPGTDPHDAEAMRTVMHQIPMSAFLVLLASVGVAGVAGAWVAARLSRTAARRNGMIVGALLLCAMIWNLFTLPHPVWFAITAVLIVLPAAWLGGRLAVRPSQN